MEKKSDSTDRDAFYSEFFGYYSPPLRPAFMMTPKKRPFSEGPNKARVMMIGQNPGKEEIRQNRPFVGRAGAYLDKILHKKGIDRNKLYITSVVKAPTPGNRKPTPKEIAQWMPCLIDEIREIKPEIIVLMGRVAWETPRFESIEYIQTYHPAAAMRFPNANQRFERDMEDLRKRMRRRNI
ncbi:MAG: uracil-DNA glycosylase [Desulfobacterales bacterium]